MDVGALDVFDGGLLDSIPPPEGFELVGTEPELDVEDRTPDVLLPLVPIFERFSVDVGVIERPVEADLFPLELEVLGSCLRATSLPLSGPWVSATGSAVILEISPAYVGL